MVESAKIHGRPPDPDCTFVMSGCSTASRGYLEVTAGWRAGITEAQNYLLLARIPLGNDHSNFDGVFALAVALVDGGHHVKISSPRTHNPVVVRKAGHPRRDLHIRATR